MAEKFDPKGKVKSIQGKDYLEVKWRIVWFRDEHPKGGIITEITQADPLLVKASIIDDDGRILATGYGSPKTQGVSKFRPVEGAETAAIGRALAHAGYGTQFTGEDEDDHLADSPVARENGNGRRPQTAQAPAPVEDDSKLPIDARPWSVAQKEALVKAGFAKNDFAAKGMLGLSALPVAATPAEIVEWGKVYRQHRATMDAQAAAANANADVLGVGV